MSDDALFVFMAGPVYRGDHPRYASVPLLVLTWQSDLISAATEHPQTIDQMNRSASRVILRPLSRSAGDRAPDIPDLSQAYAQLMVDGLFRKGLYESVHIEPTAALLTDFGDASAPWCGERQ